MRRPYSCRAPRDRPEAAAQKGRAVTGAEAATALQYALTLAEEGRRCFPCRLDKRPATPNGFKNAQNNADALRELWRLYPGPLIGVATGAISDLDVLDLDVKHHEARIWWADNRSRLPETRTHRTRSGGLHLFFQHIAGVGSTVGKIAPGVDTRGNGGYVIWWPTAGLPVLSDVPPAPWPAWPLARLQPAPAGLHQKRVVIPDDRTLGSLVRLVAGAPQGERNNLAFWAGCRAGEMARSGLIGLEAAVEVVTLAAVRAGLSRAEAERTARSGIRTGAGVGNV
jgi:Bifunctional DNA primase/polymerase, N-terminal